MKNESKQSSVHVLTRALQARHKRTMEAINNHGNITNDVDVAELVAIVNNCYDKINKGISDLILKTNYLYDIKIIEYFKDNPNHSITRTYDRFVSQQQLARAKDITTREDLDRAMARIGYITVGDKYVKLKDINFIAKKGSKI